MLVEIAGREQVGIIVEAILGIVGGNIVAVSTQKTESNERNDTVHPQLFQSESEAAKEGGSDHKRKGIQNEEELACQLK